MIKRAKTLLALAAAGAAYFGITGQASAQMYGYGQMSPMQAYAYRLMLQNMQNYSQGYGMQGYAQPGYGAQGYGMPGGNPYAQQEMIQRLNNQSEQMMQQSLQNAQQFDKDMFGN